MKAIVLSITLLLFANTSLAQSSSMSGTRRNIATIMFAGLGGAILGLSTLSFYGEPQEHIGNIWTGMAIGALAGTGYVFNQTYSPQATITNPHQLNNRGFSLVQYRIEF
jgi:hypothetical protein